MRDMGDATRWGGKSWFSIISKARVRFWATTPTNSTVAVMVKATCYLPHDGMNTNAITGLRYQDHLRDAGFYVEVIPNQGAGAAAQRIEASGGYFRAVVSKKRSARRD
jgi:hypothetical protein